MLLGRVSSALLALLALGGCAISTGFQGPGYDTARGVTAAGGGPVVVAITEAVLRADGTTAALFWDHVRAVNATLDAQPGLIGSSFRQELFGSRAWTLTVWQDEASLRSFLNADAHRAAARTATATLDDMRFARVTLARSELPLPWDRAIEILGREGYRGY